MVVAVGHNFPCLPSWFDQDCSLIWNISINLRWLSDGLEWPGCWVTIGCHSDCCNFLPPWWCGLKMDVSSSHWFRSRNVGMFTSRPWPGDIHHWDKLNNDDDIGHDGVDSDNGSALPGCMGGLLPLICMGLGGVPIMPIMCMPPPRDGGRGECCIGIPPYGPKELVRPSLLFPSIADWRSLGLEKLLFLHSTGYKYFVYLQWGNIVVDEQDDNRVVATYWVLRVKAAEVMEEGRPSPLMISCHCFLLITSTRPPRAHTRLYSSYRSSTCLAMMGRRLIGVPLFCMKANNSSRNSFLLGLSSIS